MQERDTAAVEAGEDELTAGDTNVEIALLTVLAARDTGDATQAVRLDSLSETEKEVVVRLMRERFGRPEKPRVAPEPDTDEEAGSGV